MLQLSSDVVIILSISLLWWSKFTGAQEDVTLANCTAIQSCGPCIAAGCYWCKQEIYDSMIRCNSRQSLIANNCGVDELLYSKPSVYIHNFTLNAAQLSPQNVTIRVRPNSAVRFNITFHQAENYPVDLYFLMDASYSLKDLRVRLVSLSDTLASTLQALTTNYRVGLGTFMDKTTMPYVNVEKLSSWCQGCAQPFSFKNHLALTDNVLRFQNEMNSTGLSGNLDHPEGVFDALMQTVMCTEQIGWRNQSRKLVVVSTDGEFHYAGDGLLGGLVEPNDGRCHLNEHGEIVNSEFQDYPSVSQLARKVADQKINVIFAIPDNVKHVISIYRILQQYIDGSDVSVLDQDFSNIVDLIRENFKKISGTVDLRVKKIDPSVGVSLQSSCLRGVLKETSVCEGLHIGQNVTFMVTVEVNLDSCPRDEKERKKMFQISPVGLNEELTVNVELDCECSCEKPENKDALDVTKCSGQGIRECGVCVCEKDFYGKLCECSSSDDELQCRRNRSSLMCEGHGRCYCGTCECEPISNDPEKKFSGDFCEFNDYICDYYDGQICGGESRGVCKFGQCICKPGWQGDKCDCSTDQSQCITTKGKICNGKGVCQCGKCSCTTDLFFTGPTCESCPTCTGKCEQYAECVKRSFNAESSESKLSAFCPSIVDRVDNLVDGDLNWAKNETETCEVHLDNWCNTTFVYNHELDALKILKEKTCRKEENIIYVIIGVIVGILAVGLTLLFTWKVFVTLHDRREYARFQEEKNLANFGTTMNPIYKDATTTFTNPTFASEK